MQYNKELTELAQSLAQEYWGLPFNIPVKLGKLRKKRYGEYRSERIRKNGKTVRYNPISITLSNEYDFLNPNKKELMLSVLKHELCHWACQQLRKPFKDGSIFFETELNRIGAFSTGNNIFSEEGHERNHAHQLAYIEGKKNRLGSTDFTYELVDDMEEFKNNHGKRFTKCYRVYYKGTYVGYIGDWGYGKYRWNPVSNYKEYGNLSWTTRKHAVEDLKNVYERHEGVI